MNAVRPVRCVVHPNRDTDGSTARQAGGGGAVDRPAGVGGASVWQAGGADAGGAGGAPTGRDDLIAEEVAVALVFNGISHAVMMATPAGLDEFGLGFAFTEGIIGGPDDVRGIDVEAVTERDGTLGRDAAQVHLDIAPACLWKLKERRRALTGRTGCGLCGVDSLAEAVRPVTRREPAPLDARAVQRARALLDAQQSIRRQTGATHAAAWCAPDGTLLLVREDVGRHNALDKLIGALLTHAPHDPASPRSRPGFALISSRASHEMVFKAAHASIGALAALSAPTALAVDTAREAGMVLAGFVRPHAFTVYCHDTFVTDATPQAGPDRGDPAGGDADSRPFPSATAR